MKEYEYNITSQSGEDGVIAEIFRRLGIDKGVCVEVGAWDGKHLSNTWNLWHNKGWKAYLYEKDKERLTQLISDVVDIYESNPSIPDRITVGAEFKIGDQLPVDNVDLLSIDVDGDDYYIWDRLEGRPKVVVIEYNPTIPFWANIVQKQGENFGASSQALIILGHRLGYKLIHATETNLIWLHEDYNIAPECDTPRLVFDEKYLSYVISGYDGKRFLIDNCPYNDDQTERWPEVVSDIPLTKVEIKKVE